MDYTQPKLGNVLIRKVFISKIDVEQTCIILPPDGWKWKSTFGTRQENLRSVHFHFHLCIKRVKMYFILKGSIQEINCPSVVQYFNLNSKRMLLNSYRCHDKVQNCEMWQIISGKTASVNHFLQGLDLLFSDCTRFHNDQFVKHNKTMRLLCSLWTLLTLNTGKNIIFTCK